MLPTLLLDNDEISNGSVVLTDILSVTCNEYYVVTCMYVHLDKVYK